MANTMLAMNPQVGGRRSSLRSLTEAKVTPVILVCVYNQNSTLITHDLLRDVFSTYGKVQRILIFEKLKVWKAFLEYAELDSAIEAKKNLNDHMLFSDGTRMNVYYSNLNRINFQNTNSGGKDYTLEDGKHDSDSLDDSASNHSGYKSQPDFESGPPPITHSLSVPVSRFAKEKNFLMIPSEAPSLTSVEYPQNFGDVEDTTSLHSGFRSQQEAPPITHSLSVPVSRFARDKYLITLSPSHSFISEERQQDNANDSNMSGYMSQDNESGPPAITHSLSVPVSQFAREKNFFGIKCTTPNRSPQANFRLFANDDKEDELLKMINDQQKEAMAEVKDHEHHHASEEEKKEQEDTEKDIYSQFFSNVFPKVPEADEKAKSCKSQSGLSVKSQPFGQSKQSAPNTNWARPNFQIQSQANSLSYKQSIINFQKQNILSKSTGPYNSLNQLPMNNNSPNGKYKTKLTSATIIPKQGPSQNNISPFNSMTNIPNNYGNYQQLSPSRPDSMTQTSPFHSRSPTGQRYPAEQSYEHQPNQGYSPNGLQSSPSNFENPSYDNLVDLIEGDIKQNWAYLQSTNGLASLTANGPNGSDMGAFLQESLGAVDGQALSQMSLSGLSQLYNELSILLGKADENKKSQILYVKGFEDSTIQVQMIYNIFSNFGNICKIVFLKNKAAALIEFENSDYAAVAKEYLNNIVFMGVSLRMYFSNYSITSVGNKPFGSDPSEEIFVGNPKTFRFKKYKNISINPPSPILHISNLIREVCQEQLIEELFSQYGKIDSMRFMFVENKNMCLMRMASVEDALHVMAYLHDMDFYGRKMQISFTRTKF